MKVECGITTCSHNQAFNESYGYCRCPDNIVLKWRLAADMGKGTIVMLECLSMHILSMVPPDAA
jgi:hypothetical protein